jgi:hypothetical protein
LLQTTVKNCPKKWESKAFKLGINYAALCIRLALFRLSVALTEARAASHAQRQSCNQHCIIQQTWLNNSSSRNFDMMDSTYRSLSPHHTESRQNASFDHSSSCVYTWMWMLTFKLVECEMSHWLSVVTNWYNQLGPHLSATGWLVGVLSEADGSAPKSEPHKLKTYSVNSVTVGTVELYKPSVSELKPFTCGRNCLGCGVCIHTFNKTTQHTQPGWIYIWDRRRASE